MGRRCSTYGAIQKCIQRFNGKTRGKETFREAETNMGGQYKMDLREVVVIQENG